MKSNLNKLIITVAIISVTLMNTACGSQVDSESGGKDSDIKAEAQAVAAATPTDTPAPPSTPTPKAKPTSTNLPTEIIEPISPVSPVAPAGEAMKFSDPSAQIIPGSEKAVEAALTNLVTQTGLSANEITIISVESKEWSDSGLGCPQEGFMYAQVITPGYLIVLEAQGEQYNYHTNQDGSSVVLCKQ